MRKAMTMAVCFLTGFLVAQPVKFPAPQSKVVKAQVVRVIDGDTIDAMLEGETKPIRVRIIGYDAPEKGENFGEKATGFLKALIEGRQVLLEADVQAFDRYGRRLYHVWLPQVLGSELMLLSGLGRQMTIPPNVRYADLLTQAQRTARTLSLGIWEGSE